MTWYVLDSFALLAFLNKEPGWERVKELLTAARDGDAQLHMSIINLAEVQYATMRRHRDSAQKLELVASLPITTASADMYVPEVVQLKARYPISLADCFAVALAQDLDCPVVTGDPEFRKVEEMVKVEWI